MACDILALFSFYTLVSHPLRRLASLVYHPHCQVSSFLLIYIYIYFCYMIHYLFFLSWRRCSCCSWEKNGTSSVCSLLLQGMYGVPLLSLLPCLLASFLPSPLFDLVWKRSWEVLGRKGKEGLRELCYYFSVIDL
jgi:hypothetical protein